MANGSKNKKKFCNKEKKPRRINLRIRGKFLFSLDIKFCFLNTNFFCMFVRSLYTHRIDSCYNMLLPCYIHCCSIFLNSQKRKQRKIFLPNKKSPSTEWLSFKVRTLDTFSFHLFYVSYFEKKNHPTRLYPHSQCRQFSSFFSLNKYFMLWTHVTWF